MIKNGTEKQYRQIELDSSSSIKEFITDRKKYYKKYVLKEPINEKTSRAAIIGSMVDSKILPVEGETDKFYVYEGEDFDDTTLMGKFIHNLYNVTEQNTTEDGEVLLDMSTLLQEAYDLTGYKTSFKSVVNSFNSKGGVEYYTMLRETKPLGLEVVSLQDETISDNIVETLRTDDVTSGIFNLSSDERFEVHNQFKVFDFEYNGLKLKAMLDKVIIDHKNKKIDMYDLKVTWNVENFFEQYYLKRYSHIQAAVYTEAMKFYMQENNLSDYSLRNIIFIVADSANFYAPMLYKILPSSLKNCYLGFEYKGKDYIGLDQAIEELKWAKENNIFNQKKSGQIETI